MAARLNCWIAAMWIWLAGHGIQYAWIRRSHAFAGLVPHFGYGDRTGLRTFRSIEYRPPKGRRWTPKDYVILFEGEWLVCHYKLVAVRRHPTKEMALHDFWKQR
jgi:hypothetical protein